MAAYNWNMHTPIVSGDYRLLIGRSFMSSSIERIYYSKTTKYSTFTEKFVYVLLR